MRLTSALALTAATLLASAVQASSPMEDRVGAAIVRAVSGRLADSRVIVERVQIFNTPAVDGEFEAIPAGDGRTGGVVAFTLVRSVHGNTSPHVVTVGRASALVHVFAPHTRAKRLLARGEVVASGDLETAEGEIVGALLKHLPTIDECLGGRTLRNVAAGEMVTAASLVTTPAVRSGQYVRAIVSVEGAEVSAMVVAAQSGEPGRVIRVFNRDTRHELRARVVAEGIVEIIHD
jgi:flagella basal body P-ring formation protein FlgA